MTKLSPDALRRILEDNLEPESVEALLKGANFRDAGLDSLDLSAVFYDVAEETGLEMNDEDVEKLKSIEDLYDLFGRG